MPTTFAILDSGKALGFTIVWSSQFLLKHVGFCMQVFVNIVNVTSDWKVHGIEIWDQYFTVRSCYNGGKFDLKFVKKCLSQSLI